MARIPAKLVLLARESAAAYTRNLCPQLASAIAYRVLFSIFPLAIFFASLFGVLIENDERREELVTWIVDHLSLSEAGSDNLDAAVQGLATPSSAVGLVAFLGVLWAASGMMASIRIALTSLWGAQRRQAWRGKAFDLGLVLLAGLLILVAFSLTLVVRLVEDLGERIGEELGLARLGAAAGDGTQLVVSLGLVFATVLLLYRYVPPSRPSLADLWLPALLVAVAVQVTQWAFGIYLSRFADYNLVYGSLGAAVGFLFLVYLCAAIFLFGAQLAAVWPRLSTEARRH
ncbi:MAG TPA: YihY/virulence factor BrkB family protein [Gaiellaceae bacterium]|nr:YihY/virulence factor BrkB family protein [Gaiellaceae bacterium]